MTTAFLSGPPASSALQRASVTTLAGVFLRSCLTTWGDPAADARRALGDDAYEAARAAGYAMDPDSAVAFAADAT